MIRKKIIIAFVLSLFMIPVMGQSVDEAFQIMKGAFNKGDYTSLSNLFADSIDLTVLTTEGIYSKTQAKGILKDFFSTEKPKSFQIKHQGSSNDGTVYAIGLFVSTNKSCRVYALFKEKQGIAKIVQLQIEEEI
ncbi:MAG: DUF4783 domain-containing protein [Bacteroidales bacterium]|nr:DUF4783 domain-containing protein [Bacteroidales bacterium]